MATIRNAHLDGTPAGRCKKSEEEIGKALTGIWREEHRFILKQSLELYDFYSGQVEACDAEIERVYALTRPDWEVGELAPLPARKRQSHRWKSSAWNNTGNHWLRPF